MWLTPLRVFYSERGRPPHEWRTEMFKCFVEWSQYDGRLEWVLSQGNDSSDIISLGLHNYELSIVWC